MFSYITLTGKNEVLSVALPLPPLCEPPRTSYETIRSTWPCLDQLLQFLCILLCSLCCKLCTSFFPIMQMGSHKELLRNEGLYARLTRRQADAVAWRWHKFWVVFFIFLSAYLRAAEWFQQHFYRWPDQRIFRHEKIAQSFWSSWECEEAKMSRSF